MSQVSHVPLSLARACLPAARGSSEQQRHRKAELRERGPGLRRELSPYPAGRPAERLLAEIDRARCHGERFLDSNHRPGPEHKGVKHRLSLLLPSV